MNRHAKISLINIASRALTVAATRLRAAFCSVLALVCALAFTCCSADDDDNGPSWGNGSSDERELSFDIVMPAVAVSRTPSGDYDPGSAVFENEIDLSENGYRIYFFSTDNVLISDFKPTEVIPASPVTAGGSKRYTVSGKVEFELPSSLKVVMVANWPSYPELTAGESTIADLVGYGKAVDETSPYTYNAVDKFVLGKTDSKCNYIPLFGVKECSGLSFMNNMKTWLGQLHLLRAVAKIEIFAADDSAPIEKVTLEGYNSIGYCAPRDVTKESDYVKGNYKQDYVDHLTLVGGKNDAAPGSHQLARQGDSFVVYVPEYQIIDAADPTKPIGNAARLSIKFQGETKEHYVDFKYYSSDAAEANGANVGDFFDIKRNYYYRFQVRRVLGDPIVPIVHVDVLPYSAVVLNPNFGLPREYLTLSESLIQLYNDTKSERRIVARNSAGADISATVDWSIVNQGGAPVTEIMKRVVDGETQIWIVSKGEKAKGRDVIVAKTTDSFGFEISEECVAEVTERMLYLDHTFLGISPKSDSSKASGQIKAAVVAETDDDPSRFTYELWDVDLKNKLFDINPATGLNDPAAPLIISIENDPNYPSRPSIKVESTDVVGNFNVKVYYRSPNGTTYNNYCTVYVVNAQIICNPEVLSVTAGQTTSISSSVTPLFSNSVPTIKYESSDPSIATVNDFGVVTGIAKGTAYIRVYNDTDFDRVVSSIANDGKGVKIIVDDSNLILKRPSGVLADQLELRTGDYYKLQAFSHGQDVTSQCEWQSEDTAIATFTATKGVLHAEKAGSVIVTAKYKDLPVAKCVVVVTDAARTILFNECPGSISVNAKVPLKPYVYPNPNGVDAPGYTLDDVKFEITVGNGNVVTFDPEDANNVISAVATGKATVKATVTFSYDTYNSAGVKTTKTETVSGSTTFHVVDGGYVPPNTSVRLVLKLSNGKTLFADESTTPPNIILRKNDKIDVSVEMDNPSNVKYNTSGWSNNSSLAMPSKYVHKVSSGPWSLEKEAVNWTDQRCNFTFGDNILNPTISWKANADVSFTDSSGYHGIEEARKNTITFTYTVDGIAHTISFTIQNYITIN